MRFRWVIPFLISLATHAAIGAGVMAWMAARSRPPRFGVAAGAAVSAATVRIEAEEAEAEEDSSAAADLPESPAESVPRPPDLASSFESPAELIALLDLAPSSDAPAPSPKEESISLDPSGSMDEAPAMRIAAEADPAPIVIETDLAVPHRAETDRASAWRQAARRLWAVSAAAIAQSSTLPPAEPASARASAGSKATASDGTASGASAQAANPRRGGSPGAVAPQVRSGNAAPRYPDECRRRREEGTVVLLVRVDTGGRVAKLEIHASSGVALLDEAALEAVRSWRFDPATEDGAAIAAEVRVPVEFVLRRSPSGR